VTYWDQLGWKDTFDQPGFTQRQWDYAHYAGRGNVATPQVIVNGRAAIVGSNRAELQQLSPRKGRPPADRNQFVLTGSVSIGSGKAPAAGNRLARPLRSQSAVGVDPRRRE